MFEFIVVIALLVVLPYLFHMWITSRYHDQSKTFFGNDDINEEDSK